MSSKKLRRPHDDVILANASISMEVVSPYRHCAGDGVCIDETLAFARVTWALVAEFRMLTWDRAIGSLPWPVLDFLDQFNNTGTLWHASLLFANGLSTHQYTGKLNLPPSVWLELAGEPNAGACTVLNGVYQWKKQHHAPSSGNQDCNDLMA